MHKIDGGGHVNNQFSSGGSGVDGTIATPAWLNAVQGELVKLVESAGVALKTSADDTMDQVLLALKHPGMIHPVYVDSGAANAHVITTTPSVSSLSHGMLFRFTAAASNTWAATLNVNGIGAKEIRRFSNTALIANEIIVSSIVTVVYDSSADRFHLVTPSEYDVIQSRLTNGSLNDRISRFLLNDGTPKHYNQGSPWGNANPFVMAWVLDLGSVHRAP